MKKILLDFTLIRYQQDVSQIREIVFRNCKIQEKCIEKAETILQNGRPFRKAEILTLQGGNGKLT